VDITPFPLSAIEKKNSYTEMQHFVWSRANPSPLSAAKHMPPVKFRTALILLREGKVGNLALSPRGKEKKAEKWAGAGSCPSCHVGLGAMLGWVAWLPSRRRASASDGGRCQPSPSVGDAGVSRQWVCLSDSWKGLTPLGTVSAETSLFHQKQWKGPSL